MKKFVIVLAFLTYLSMYLSEGADITDRELRRTAKSFRENTIPKFNLTCENYASFCDGPAHEAMSPPISCKIWMDNLLCRNVTDIEELRKTVDAIERAMEATKKNKTP